MVCVGFWREFSRVVSVVVVVLAAMFVVKWRHEMEVSMKKVLAFDVDETLNVSKMPITEEMAKILGTLIEHYEVCPISGQKYEQFLVQLVEPMKKVGVSDEALARFHMFVAQGTQYYRFEGGEPKLVYNEALSSEQAEEISVALEKAAREMGYWEEDKLMEGDEIIENRESMMAFSALGQKASVDAKKAWDPDMKKRNAMAKRAKELAPAYEFEVGGTTTINAFIPGMNKVFGMTRMMEYLEVEKDEILYFGDMTQPGGNDFPVVEMGVDTITVHGWRDTAYAIRGILGLKGVIVE